MYKNVNSLQNYGCIKDTVLLIQSVLIPSSAATALATFPSAIKLKARQNKIDVFAEACTK